jgi:hypothetical protein
MLITFSSQDINLTSFPHTDAMVITIHIDRWDVTKILVDNDSQAEILFLATFDKMGFNQKQLREPSKPLYGFSGKRIKLVETITLPMSFGTPKNPQTEYITFDVVDMAYPYNAIFGRGLLNSFKAALHSTYLCLKVSATFGVITIFSSQQEARNIEKGFAPGHKNVHFLREQQGQHETQPSIECRKFIEAEYELKKVPLDPRVPDKTVCIGTEANQQDQVELLSFLDKNNDVFAWSISDLVGVSRDVIEHRLQVSPSAKPKKQKLHKMADEKIQAAKAEVQRLLDASFIREVVYPKWLSNVVMVRKKNGKWWMCTDFTDLNKCCTKDDFPLTRTYQIVDSAVASEMMALLDCFSGYHQIWLRPKDEEKTSFIAPFETYFYLRMIEGLRNAGPTFYRMTKASLKDQVGRNVLSYIDDIVVVSKKKKIILQTWQGPSRTCEKPNSS